MFEPDFSKMNGLLPVIAQDKDTKEVLMVAFMNKESWNKTIETGTACYFSRSRNKLWLKGEESGNVQRVHDILVDCDGDTIVLLIDQVGGAACHTGYNTCFYRRYKNGELEMIPDKEKVFDPDKVYKKNRHG